MRLLTLLISFIILTSIAFSQTSDLGSWNILNLKYSHSEKLSFFGEAQLRSLRFYNHFHYYEFKGGINYSLHKSVSLSLGAGSYQTYKEGGNFRTPKNNDEFRLWPQLLISQQINKLKIEQRYRVEMRWTSNGYRNRFRYRVGASYPFGKTIENYQPFQIGISNELFFTNREPYFERNRLLFNLNFKPVKSATIQLGYLHQFDYQINDETGRDFFQLGFSFDLKNKKNQADDQKKEIKGDQYD